MILTQSPPTQKNKATQVNSKYTDDLPLEKGQCAFLSSEIRRRKRTNPATPKGPCLSLYPSSILNAVLLDVSTASDLSSRVFFLFFFLYSVGVSLNRKEQEPLVFLSLVKQFSAGTITAVDWKPSFTHTHTQGGGGLVHNNG